MAAEREAGIGADARPAVRCPPAPARLILTQLQQAAPRRLRDHHRRVGAMCARLARGLGLGEADVRDVGRAGGLHDIGMALLPGELLNYKGGLSSSEKSMMRRHGSWAEQILRMTGDPALRLAAQVAAEHHERWDGSGYPHGLKGGEICLGARIVAICAVYDALRNPRPGKPALGHAAALGVLRDGDALSGPDAFDPRARDRFVGDADAFRRISESSG